MGTARAYKFKSTPDIMTPGIELCVMSGNTKLGKIWNTSLPPIWSCPKNAPCYRDCYAMKAYRQYPGTRDAWGRNYKLYQADPNEYFRQIDDFLTDVHPDNFRWLVAGDVPDMRYMSGILHSANVAPKTQFCLFTKNYTVLSELTRSRVPIPKNLTVLVSGWPTYRIPCELRDNYRVAWMQDGTETRAPENAIICAGSCIDCLKCYNPRIKRDVILPIH